MEMSTSLLANGVRNDRGPSVAYPFALILRLGHARSIALQWGLISYWAKDPKIVTEPSTPEAETVDKAPSYRQAFAKRRCLIPAENWKDPESGERLRTYTIITGEPNELVAQIHPRMPVIFPAQHHAAWLDETDGGNLKELLLPYPADQMRMWEISPRVNSPKDDDPSLWEPLHAEPTQTTTDALELLRE
jgi:putative SOS response-associated peptidase YedK